MKKDFPIFKNKINGKKLIYLDSAATSQKPQVVIDAILEFYKTYNANVKRGLYPIAEKATEKIGKVRQEVAKFINAINPEEIIFVRNTTEAINLVAYLVSHNIKRKEGIITSTMEHHSNFVPWQQLALKKNADFLVLDIDENGFLDLDSGIKNYELRIKSENDYVEKTKELLKDSIKMQMVSDVPFGCFLSGGVDSSLNTALMSQALHAPLETFTIGTKNDDKYNEFQYARRVAYSLGAKNHERLLDFDDFARFLQHYGEYTDDPNADPTCFLVFYLSELVRDTGVTVIQTGEGGDELFAGYDTYKKAGMLYPTWRILKNMPSPLLRIAHRGLRIAKDNARELSRRLAANEEPFWGHAIAFSSLQKEKLLSQKFQGAMINHSSQNSEYALIAQHYKKINELAPGMDYLNQIAYLDIKMRIADFLLMRVDKMAMAHSIEARVPFLDYRIVELALQIPARIKLKNGELKHVLKSAARGVLPDEIIARQKQGFGAPVEEWFRDREKSGVLMEKIYNSRLAERGFFDYDYVRDLHASHLRGENHTFRLMTLLTLSLWYDRWFG